MKKLFFSIIFISAIMGLAAQDITISFQPKVPGTPIDSIWVTNLKTNQKVKFMGNESLTLTKTTGVNVLSSPINRSYLYPNPCCGDAMVSLSTSINQKVEIRVYNISGKLLNTKSQYLDFGNHKFSIKFPTRGIYAVSILSNEAPLSFKAVCTGGKKQESNIDYSGNESFQQLKIALAEKSLSYTLGDNLLYSAFSGKNNTLITDSPTSTKFYSVEFYECIDPDKQSYPSVKIGNQVWMAENLAYLPSVSPPTQGSNIAPYYYVNGYTGTDVAAAKANPYFPTYGVLYNWPAAMAGSASSDKNPSGVRGICPQNWHLPSDAEWTQLENYLITNGYNYDGTTSGNKIAKAMAAQTLWNSYSGTGTVGNNLSANNKSVFSGLPGGYRGTGGNFGGIGSYGYWWSSTEGSAAGAWSRYLGYGNSGIYRYDGGKEGGFSVRCVRDF